MASLFRRFHVSSASAEPKLSATVRPQHGLWLLGRFGLPNRDDSPRGIPLETRVVIRVACC
jgi:hypothetical protein